MKVLHVVEPNRAGVPNYVANLGSSLRQGGLVTQQAVIVTAEQEVDFSAWADDVVHLNWNRSLPSCARASLSVTDYYHRFKPDVVHAHSTYSGIVTRISKIPTSKICYQPHGWGYHSAEGRMRRLVKATERVLARRAHTIAVLSAHEDIEGPYHRRTVKTGPLVTREFTPLSHSQKMSYRQSVGWDPSAFVVVYPAEVSRRKRQLELIQRWAGATESHGETHLCIVGDGPELSKLEVASANHPNVSLLGWRSDIASILASADASILFSSGEGFALTIIESLMCGTPVISTDIGGSEIIGSEDGYVLLDDDDLELAIKNVVNLERSYQSRLNRAKKARSLTSSQAVVARFEQVYSSMKRRSEAL